MLVGVTALEGLAHSAPRGMIFYIRAPRPVLDTGYLYTQRGKGAVVDVMIENLNRQAEQYRVVAYLGQMRAFVSRAESVAPDNEEGIRVKVMDNHPGFSEVRCVLYVSPNLGRGSWRPYRALRWWLVVPGRSRRHTPWQQTA